MRPKPPEDHRSQHQEEPGDSPKIQGQLPVLPEPDPVDEAVAVPFDNVDHRVQLDDELQIWRDELKRPEDGSAPEEELQGHCHQLPHVAEEDDHRRGEPGKASEEEDASNKVVE